MRVRVFSLRHHGRRTRRADEAAGVKGELRMFSMVHGSEMHMVARLSARADRGSAHEELLPPLYRPELVAVGDNAMLLRGFQSIDGTAYVQEWRCLLD